MTAASGPDTTDDAFLGGALKITQPKAGYRAGVDAVLLAAAAPVIMGRAERVLDAGCGVGVVGLAVARRVSDADVTMVERDAALAAHARTNVAHNGLSARVHVVEADVTRALGESRVLAATAGTFHHVLANPPFHTEGRGTPAPDASRATSHAMPAGDLERWSRFLAAMTRPGGTLSLIHRAAALGEILRVCEGRFGDLAVLPLHPKAGEVASRVLVQGVKGSRAPLRVLSGVVLHTSDGTFRPEIEAVLRAGAALRITGV